jgi:hypothetical protein
MRIDCRSFVFGNAEDRDLFLSTYKDLLEQTVRVCWLGGRLYFVSYSLFDSKLISHMKHFILSLSLCLYEDSTPHVPPFPRAQAEVQLLLQEQAREEEAQRFQQAELDLYRAEAAERKARQQWAIDAMEEERNRLLYSRYMEQLALDRDESLQRNLLRLEHAALTELERARQMQVWS